MSVLATSQGGRDRTGISLEFGHGVVEGHVGRLSVNLGEQRVLKIGVFDARNPGGYHRSTMDQSLSCVTKDEVNQ